MIVFFLFLQKSRIVVHNSAKKYYPLLSKRMEQLVLSTLFHACLTFHSRSMVIECNAHGKMFQVVPGILIWFTSFLKMNIKDLPGTTRNRILKK